MKVAVVYFTHTDVTGALARALVESIKGAGPVEVLEHSISGSEIIEGRFRNQPLLDALNSCDAIVFGSPTYMGSVAAQFKAFADATSELWCEQRWAGKLAAGFTCGSALNGDQAATLQYMATLANQQGMLWLGLSSTGEQPAQNEEGDTETLGINRLGCQAGVVAQSADGTVDPRDLATAAYLGKRITEQLMRFKN
ncbi:flavodoxin family protein [Aliamphritea ceti]|uniref:flavodoxin family protein n=1 Tax=Aliamphritea ceti TaxID=1524258 RepID=UPI0021C27911|nr:NAD(P)H-dependent oxidoreductase [Aliamphritea ceti]